jgi:hypothetical protein
MALPSPVALQLLGDVKLFFTVEACAAVADFFLTLRRVATDSQSSLVVHLRLPTKSLNFMGLLCAGTPCMGASATSGGMSQSQGQTMRRNVARGCADGVRELIFVPWESKKIRPLNVKNPASRPGLESVASGRRR